jgi:hypothetical protein
MKILKPLYLFLILILFGFSLKAQDIEVIIHETFKYEPVGIYEIVIDFEIVNISNEEQIVFEVRTIDSLPPGWTSSLCFGEFCFPPEIDSIITAPPFPEPPVQPGDTLATSIHVFTDTTILNIGTAYVQIQIGTLSNPDDRVTIDFVITNDPSVNVKDENLPSGYFLSQNYPNPFNPSTKINYGVKEGGFVSLKIYNILGVETATLVNEYKPAGIYEKYFDASRFSSGVYFYRLSVNGFTQTRKMILEK